jgi:hypothetical protein
MLSDRMAAVLALLGGTGHSGAGLSPTGAVAAATALGVDGLCAGVGAGPEGIVVRWGREGTSAALEEAEFTLGEGPGGDCMTAGAPVFVADLAGAAARWPAFTPAALELGVRAVFALPLRIGAISVGRLLAHRDTPGSLLAGQLRDALALADTLTVLLLRRATDEPARATAEQARQAGADGPRPGWAPPATHRVEVHQATGMVSVQLGVTLAEALVRLRAHAYAEGRPLNEVAADVVARRLRLEDSDA